MNAAALAGRASGILLHPTSLPGGSIGDLGPAAYRFVDWLAGAEQEFWQLLPLVPVGAGGSPYDGLSAFAGNPLLLSPDLLVEEGWLDPADVAEGEERETDRVDVVRATRFKERVVRRAFAAFGQGRGPALASEWDAFRREHVDWLDDYALFAALREHHGGASWSEWPHDVRTREPGAVERWRDRLAEPIERHAFGQWLFDRQWGALREAAHRRGVRIIGDIPIFVAYDSADVWANQELFRLDAEGRPLVVAGVPPDYFSETGQRWGNPLYDWERMEARGWRWWTERFRRTLQQVDVARIDHFRGFQAFWEIPAGNPTAVNGRWRPGPGRALFRAVERALGPLPLIAEDLGLITHEVEALRDELGFPGMRVLQFASDGEPENPHLPANHPRGAVAYTGTHDNDTALGWYAGASGAEQKRFRALADDPDEPVDRAMLRLVWESPADLAIAPLQDVLGLGSEARMNTPGTAGGNWGWRYTEGSLTEPTQARLRELTRATGRSNTSRGSSA